MLCTRLPAASTERSCAYSRLDRVSYWGAAYKHKESCINRVNSAGFRTTHQHHSGLCLDIRSCDCLFRILFQIQVSTFYMKAERVFNQIKSSFKAVLRCPIKSSVTKLSSLFSKKDEALLKAKTVKCSIWKS